MAMYGFLGLGDIWAYLFLNKFVDVLGGSLKLSPLKEQICPYIPSPKKPYIVPLLKGEDADNFATICSKNATSPQVNSKSVNR